MIQIDELRENRTEVVLNFGSWRVRMEIRGPGSPQERRQLGKAISEAVSKTFKIFESRSWITHPEGFWANIERDQRRGMRLGRGVDLDTESGRAGFEIRMKRLKLGWTLKDLAEKAGLNFSHLSLVERGMSEVKGETLSKIQQAFANGHPKPPKKGERRKAVPSVRRRPWLRHPNG